MKKALIIIDNDERIKEYCDIMVAEADRAKERVKFLQKQADDITAKIKENSDRQFELIKKRLKELKLFPADYDEEKHHLVYNKEAGLVYLEDKDSYMTFQEFMSNIWKPK